MGFSREKSDIVNRRYRFVLKRNSYKALNINYERLKK